MSGPPSYPIETERLLMRPFELGDLDGLLAIHSRPDVARYTPWEARDAEALRPVLERKSERSWLREAGESMSFAALLRDGGTLVGDCSLHWISEEHMDAEIGFAFHPDHHGRGYAREAMEVVIGLCFERLGFHRLIGRADARNDASVRLMERLGMRREAHFIANGLIKGEWTDELVYAILRDEWALSRTAP